MEVENTLANLTKRVIVLENLEAMRIQQLADARIALAAARVHVAEYKNINRDTVTYALPNELLAAIFEAGSTDRPVLPQIVEFPIKISHVSRHWREIALHTPSLWSTIHMDENTSYPKLLDAYLDRSGACPLDIVMDYQYRSPPSRILRETFYLHKILPHIDRWHSLWVGAASNEIACNILPHLRNLRAPLLKRLVVFGEQDDLGYDLYLNVFMGGAPHLSFISLTTLNMQSCWPPLAALTNLELKWTPRPTSHGDFRRIVVTALSLRKLSLWAGAVDFDITSPICIASLESFEITPFSGVDDEHERDVSIPLRALEMPALKNFALPLMEVDHFSKVANLLRVQIPQHNFPGLQHLDLSSSTIHQADAAAFMVAFPTVVQVSLLGHGPYFHCYSVLEVLSGDRSLDSPLWPQLSNITLDGIDEHGANLLHTVLQNRIHIGRPITSVTSKSFSGIPKYILERLRQDVQLWEY
jgi:hypothetical protein